MSEAEVKKIYNKVFCHYKHIGSEVVVFATDYPYIDTQKVNEHNKCNICYYIVNKRSMNKTTNYEYSQGCVYKLIDDNKNIISYGYKEEKRIKTRTLYDVLQHFFEDISFSYLCNKPYGEYINPTYKKTIVDKLLIKDYDKYKEIFNEKVQIKINKCQICDSREVCGQRNVDNDIIFYCVECNPHISL